MKYDVTGKPIVEGFSDFRAEVDVTPHDYDRATNEQIAIYIAKLLGHYPVDYGSA